MPDAIIVENLSKRFDAVQAVDAISFRVEQGELFGFLGPNGAGKTTTINMLTGLARPDGGTIRIGGIDCTLRPKTAQHLVGVVPDESNLYTELSGWENLWFCAALYGMSRREREARAQTLLDDFGLRAAAKRKFGGYSKGMKRKLTIAAGIIHRPPILFLDEPTTGIDVASARQVRALIGDLHRGGTTIFLTTHYIEEAERLCGRIAFIDAGRILRVDTLENLLRPVQHRNGLEIACTRLPADIAEDLAAALEGLTVDVRGPAELRVTAERPVAVGPLVRLLEARGVEVVEVRRIRRSLEDIFVEITGIAANAMRKEKEKPGGGRR